MSEIWKPIKGYPLYEVSNFGRVKSLGKMRHNRFDPTEIILKECYNRDGYSQVMLSCGRRKTFKVHRLVAEAFIKNIQNKPEVNHKDGVKSNNFLNNLEWATTKENARHAFKIGLRSSDCNNKKVAQIKNGKILKVWKSQIEASRFLGICKKRISKCCYGSRDSEGGFQWKFI